MNIHKEVIDDVVVLSPSGRIDSNAAGAFEAAMSEALTGAQRMVVDFSDVPYISSAGLRVVLIGAKRMAATQGGFVLCGLSESVMDVFQLSGFASILKILEGKDAAMAAVKG